MPQLSLAPASGAPLTDAETKVVGNPARTRERTSALPPHLEPNPISSAFSAPSPVQKFCVALFSWALIAGACALVVILSRKAQARHAEPRTVTLLIDSGAEMNVPPPPSPQPASAPSGGPQSETPNESTSSYFDPRAAAHPELAEEPLPVPSMAVPMEGTLLPTRPVIYSGGGGQGTPGVMGSGMSGPGTSGSVARWGDGGPISGERRGVTVEMDSLDVLHQDAPGYPPAARAAKITGEVVVDVVIDEKGIPIEVVIVRSDHILLTPSVMAVTPKWRFTPVLFGGKRVRANFRICYRFILETR